MIDLPPASKLFVSARAPGCPWADWAPGTVQFCEERLCAWVAEPSNAWSSLAYIVIGLFMVRRALRPAEPRSLMVAVAQILIGIGSFFFHGSGTFWGELVDQIGMFMLSGLILACSAAQARSISGRRTVTIYVSLVVASTLLLLVVRPIGIPLFALQLAAGLGWQILLWSRSSGLPRAAHRPFFVGVGLFLVSFAIWITDISRLICRPDNHVITGHAVWHVLNAISIERLFTFYRNRFAASPASGAET